MTGPVAHALAIACLALAAGGCLHALAAAFRVRRFRAEGEPALDAFPGVTILKPLAATAWGTSSSFLCVKSPQQRTGTVSTGGSIAQCDGTMSLDFADILLAVVKL